MCGFIGIIGTQNVAEELLTGLLMLQHRGQDATGIVTSDYEQLYLQKGRGMIAEFFNKDRMKYFSGRMGVGHVRYPTVGSDSSKDSQPVITGNPNMGLAHNGNMMNFTELKEYLESKRNRQIRSNCDAELLLKLLADEILKLTNRYHINAETIFTALEGVMEKVNGSYSACATLSRNGLLAFRDPYGIRPIVFGKRHDERGVNYAFASESSALSVLGFEIIKDLEPGEAVYIDMDNNVHSKIIKQEKRAHCMFEWVYFARPDSVIEEKGVYEIRLNLGRELAKAWKKLGKTADVVVPVPDTSRTAAAAFAEEICIPYREGLLKNRYIGRTFIMSTQKKREEAVTLKLNPISLELQDKRVVLIDDSIVRGTTGRAIVEILRSAGAKEIHLLSTCPPITCPCFYAIDFPTKEELIASQKSIEEIRASMNVDTLLYQSLDGLKSAIGLGNGVCAACLTGKYPIELSEEAVKTLKEAREKERGESQ